ncbi:hypothetical protein FA13DRAFT_1755903 [Coprinellus micaceus]|nr:hypothetical protein FA13DRAFT_1755903 [Coprinellus micaceus]
MRDSLDAIKFAGFEGCASSRQVAWALGADMPEQWDRFPNVTSWDWVPGEDCEGLEPWSKEKMVRHLVQDGGWLLIGDSVTENHFFSLSCLLHPHIIATPNYNNPLVKLTTNRGSFQHLYLNPSSPLASPLYPNPITFPPGFSLSKTPLVTFRRVDILYTKEELVIMHQELHPSFPSSTHLFSGEETHTRSAKEALDLLTAPLPYGNYGTMVVSTGGHWTTTLFSGYRDGTKEGWGVDGVVSFYEHVARRWVWEVQDRLSSEMQKERDVMMDVPGRPGALSSGPSSRKRNVVIRPYLPGHDECREAKGVLKEVMVMEYEKYNWRHIWKYNHILETLLTDREVYPNIHYLSIDRPGRLRPEAHSARDCLHIMTGAGILEGWTRYIWHFVARELGAVSPEVWP